MSPQCSLFIREDVSVSETDCGYRLTNFVTAAGPLDAEILSHPPGQGAGQGLSSPPCYTAPRMYRDLRGRPAPYGQLPALGGAAIKTRSAQVHASLPATLYRYYAGWRRDGPPDVHTLIAEHDLYYSVTRDRAVLDFNIAWVIVQDLRVSTTEMRRCPACEAPYLSASASRIEPTCPFCTLADACVRSHPRKPALNGALRVARLGISPELQPAHECDRVPTEPSAHCRRGKKIAEPRSHPMPAD